MSKLSLPKSRALSLPDRFGIVLFDEGNVTGLVLFSTVSNGPFLPFQINKPMMGNVVN